MKKTIEDASCSTNYASDNDIFEKYSNRFKNEEYASAYSGQLIASRGTKIPIRVQLIGRIVAHFEKRAISKLLRHTEGSSIIDVPCGSGKLNPILRQTKCQIISIDASPQMIKYAKGTSTQQFRFILSDIRHIPLENGSADIVISNRFLHRIPAEKHEEVLKELFRVANNSAILYFGSTTIFTPLIMKLEKIFRLGDRGDIYYLEYEKIVKEIEENNWRCIKKMRVIPLVSTGIVVLTEKLDG